MWRGACGRESGRGSGPGCVGAGAGTESKSCAGEGGFLPFACAVVVLCRVSLGVLVCVRPTGGSAHHDLAYHLACGAELEIVSARRREGCGLGDSSAGGHSDLSRVGEVKEVGTVYRSLSRGLVAALEGGLAHIQFSSTVLMPGEEVRRMELTGSCPSHLKLDGCSRIHHPKLGRCEMGRHRGGFCQAS